MSGPSGRMSKRSDCKNGSASSMTATGIGAADLEVGGAVEGLSRLAGIGVAGLHAGRGRRVRRERLCVAPAATACAAVHSMRRARPRSTHGPSSPRRRRLEAVDEREARQRRPLGGDGRGPRRDEERRRPSWPAPSAGSRRRASRPTGDRTIGPTPVASSSASRRPSRSGSRTRRRARSRPGAARSARTRAARRRRAARRASRAASRAPAGRGSRPAIGPSSRRRRRA